MLAFTKIRNELPEKRFFIQMQNVSHNSLSTVTHTHTHTQPDMSVFCSICVLQGNTKRQIAVSWMKWHSFASRYNDPIQHYSLPIARNKNIFIVFYLTLLEVSGK